jgi:soluble lytic murein transglycosylase
VPTLRLLKPSHLAAVALAAGLLVQLPSARAAVTAEDRAFLAAQAAFRAGDARRVAAQQAKLNDHVLAPYVGYWELKLRIDSVPEQRLRNFLAANAGSYPAELLRAAWLKQLGKSEQWQSFERERAALVEEDLEIRCYAVAGRLASGDAGAYAEAARLWLEPRELPKACEALAGRLAAAGRLTQDQIWLRLRVLFENGQIAAAKRTRSFLPPDARPDERQLSLAASKPHKLLSGVPLQLERRKGRELAVLATLRLANKDARAAAHALQGWLGASLPEEDREYLRGRVALEAARSHLPEALDWYRQASKSRLSDHQLAWQVRAALRAGDWTTVREAIEAMSGDARRDPTWVYWYARAHAAQGDESGAKMYYLRISSGTDFYGLLAAEELGLAATLPEPAPEPAESDIEALHANPGILRALALQRLGLREDARLEWLFTIRDMDDEALLAASALAWRAGAYDRSINTANRTLLQHNFRMRYPSPFADVFREFAQAHGVDEAWLLGIVRQESRFVSDARSGAGARGLMQILPKTARWLARTIRHKGFQVRQVNDVGTNVTLGARYLRIVQNELEHPVLVCAAYNAGPKRARGWRDGKPLEGAIYAETIPFGETRDYVKKVMANTVIYTLLLNGKAVPLKERLGTVRSRSGREQL